MNHLSSPTPRPKNKKSRLLTPLYKAYERFLKTRGHPREIALGFALGLFVGMTPLMGLHTAIAVPLAALFKWNKISAAISVWITNAVTAPLIYSITYVIGSKLIGLEKSFTLKGLNGFSGLYHLILNTPEIALAMTVGGIVLGLPLAFIGYYFTITVIRKYREDIKARIAKSKEKRALKKNAGVIGSDDYPDAEASPHSELTDQAQYATLKNPPDSSP